MNLRRETEQSELSYRKSEGFADPVEFKTPRRTLSTQGPGRMCGIREVHRDGVGYARPIVCVRHHYPKCVEILTPGILHRKRSCDEWAVTGDIVESIGCGNTDRR